MIVNSDVGRIKGAYELLGPIRGDLRGNMDGCMLACLLGFHVTDRRPCLITGTHLRGSAAPSPLTRASEVPKTNKLGMLGRAVTTISAKEGSLGRKPAIYK